VIGRTLLHYEVVARIGAGGMGEVWRARDTRLDREVAIKVLPAHSGASPVGQERFLREARAASALVHPNIITIHEINAADGVDFIVMEYIRGDTLATILTRGRLSLTRVSAYAGQVATALAAAHQAGIVHRDLKPGNIMVTSSGLVKVLDFGLAKRVNDTETGADFTTQAALTIQGTSLGTPAYMSPEQALGEPVDARSDVFSFGVVLYEMLAGHPPFQATGTVGVIRQIVHGAPPPLRDVVPDVPDALVAIVDRCLAKDSAARYASAVELGEALRVATARTVIRRAWPWRRVSRRVRWGAAATLSVGILAWTVGPTLVRVARTLVVPATEVADEDATPQELYRRATEGLRAHYRDGNVDTAVAQLERALQRPSPPAAVEARLALAYWRKNVTRPDPEWRKRALAHAERAVSTDGQLALAHMAHGAALAASGDRDAAAAAFARAGALEPGSAELQWRLADLAASQRDLTGAEAHYRQAVAAGPDDWEAYGKLGGFLYQQARYPEAITAFERMRDLASDHPRAYANLAAAYHQVDRTDDAAALLQRALEITKDSLIYSNLGTYLYFQGRYNEAVSAFDQSVALNANIYQRWGNLGDAVRMTAPGSPKMHDSYERALQLAREELARTPEDTNIRSSSALYLIRDGQTDAARAELDRVLTQATLSPSVLFKATLVAELMGQRAQALALLQRALDAGYQMREVRAEPDLVSLRADPDYHRLAARFEKE